LRPALSKKCREERKVQIKKGFKLTTIYYNEDHLLLYNGSPVEAWAL